MDDAFGYYLAGLADGEGCFAIARNLDWWKCEFIIHLRADDRPLLEHLRDTTRLGHIYVGRRSKQGGDQPSFRWAVIRKGECRIGWMTWPELTQAIPPAMTEWVGALLLAHIQGEGSSLGTPAGKPQERQA